ncbi:MAG: hypothetical protein EXR69_15130 [Myxococcales bacterium]|nr:hypothetical protein [Myxococcales bacterium]
MNLPRARAGTTVALAVVGALWATGVRAPFVYDDKVEVIGNPTIRLFSELGAMATYNVSRPLLILSYAVNWAIGGLDPVGYHVGSIAIHFVNVVLVGLILQRLVDRRVAAATALLWGIHPMCVQGVTYISGRSDALCALFWLAASLAWLLGRSRLTLGFVAAGLLTKELTVLLPVWLWFLTPHRVTDAAPDSGSPGGLVAAPPWRPFAGMAALVAAGGLLRVAMMGWPQLEVQRSVWQQAVLQAVAWDEYILLWVLPVGQSVLHDPPQLAPWPLLPMISLILWSGVVVALLWARGVAPWRASPRWPPLSLGCLLVVCWLLPSSVFPLKESIAEHRAYLVGVPLIGVVCAFLERRRVLVPVGAALGVGLAVLTIQQNGLWSSEVALWRNAARLYPLSADANYGYGDALRFAGEAQQAERAYRAVLALRPDDDNASINLGITRAEQGDPDGAHDIWTEVTRRSPRSCAAHDNLGAWARRYATRREALDEYLSAFRWCPRDPNALLNLGDLMWERGDTGLARKYYSLYLQVLPYGAEAERVRRRF